MTKRFVVAVAVIAMMTGSAMAQTWNFDKAHSSIGFSVRHMVINRVYGHFSDYSGSVTFDGEDMSQATVNVTIQAASIDTDNEKRDEHLKSSEFFAVDQYPTITFMSENIIPGEDNTFTMVGLLTIKGITKEVTLEGEMTGVLVDPWGNTRAGFHAETTINRQDFNVSWSNALKDGSLVAGNDVKIELNMELVKSDS